MHIKALFIPDKDIVTKDRTNGAAKQNGNGMINKERKKQKKADAVASA